MLRVDVENQTVGDYMTSTLEARKLGTVTAAVDDAYFQRAQELLRDLLQVLF